MRASCMSGSVRGAPSNGRSYRDVRQDKRLLAVWRGQSRPPLVLAGHAPYLMPFLGSAEGGRFFVPA